ncbi:hypothetical protein M1116_00645 [Patescibacteria group bacterium]|nr:hypothetical protein [Patescibacteria group bacterium]
MNLNLYIGFTWLFVKLSLLAGTFGLPFAVYKLKKRLPIDLFEWYLFGVVNLVAIIFLYNSINYFWDIRKINIVLFSLAVSLIQTVLIYKKSSESKLSKKVGLVDRNWRWFLIVFMICTVLYSWMNSLYFDPNVKKVFSPGYGINHDFIIVLGTAKAFFDYNPQSSKLIRDLYYHCYEAGYPCGGTHISAYFSGLFNSDVYLIYERVLTWLSVLTVIVVNYFLVNYLKKQNFLSRVVLIIISVACVLNYLSMSFIDSSVFGSTAAIPFLLLAMFLTYRYFENEEKHYLPLIFLTLIDLIYIYTYFGGIYFITFLVVATVLYWGKAWKKWKVIKIVALFLIAFLLPLNLLPSGVFLRKQVTSSVKEISLFLGMNGNMAGFNNPMTAFSIWMSNADYRFYEPSIENTWLFFTLMAPLLFFAVISDKEERSYKGFWSIGLPFIILIGAGYWLTKSPYQSGKALHWWGDIWPIVFYLILFKSLTDRRWLLRIAAFIYCLIFFYYSYRSAVFASAYIGKPIVRSNYELMGLEKKLCTDDSKLLFLGRDEMSKYFLDTCHNITFYYDRFDNNVAFWDVIKLNKLNPVAECRDDQYQLTKIDYTGYQRVLVDKCFKFQEKDYQLKQEYEMYRLYEKK